MPMMDLTYPEGALTPEARAEVVKRLTDSLLRNEGAPDNRVTQGLSWVMVHEVPEWAMNIGGRPAVRPIYRLNVTVPEGTLLGGPGPVGATSRRNLFREATEIILDADGVGYSPAEALRVYILIREIDDGYWGGAGTMVRIEDITALATPDSPATAVSGEITKVVEPMLEEQLGPEQVPVEA